MGERVSRLFQRTPVPEDTVSTDSGDYTTASDEDTASGSNDESCADSVDSGGTDYATADEDRASDSSPETSEGNVLLATEHSASISPGIATISTTPSHQLPSLSSSQPQEAQLHSHQAQASSLLVPQVQPQGSHQPLPSIPSLQAQKAQPLSLQTASLSQTYLQSSSKQSISAGPPGDSPEITALCQHSAELVKAISASDLLDLAWKLLAKRLIELDITKYCQLPAVISDEKSSKIVCAVIETVSASPHLFESLISVLSESGNVALMSVGEKLKQTHELILKEKLADSSKAHEVQLPPPSSQPQSPELCLYAKYLRAVYTRSKLPVCSKWPPSPGKRFINLAIISKEGITKEEADEFTKATLHGDLEEILKSKAPIQLEEILQAIPDEELKCVLIEGAPGVGKTTLSWEVCHCWGKGELYQEYSIVVLLRLRDQNVQRAERTADLFYYPDEETQKQIAKDIANSQGSDMLIILEGLDELPNHLISESSIFARLLSGTELPHATVLVTSRPSATYKLWINWKQQMSRHIEILGFTDGNITEYTQSVLPVSEQQKFKEYLSLHPYIRSMLYIPLHCAITVIIFLQCQQSNKPPPKTLTELYTCLTQTILIRYLNNNPDYKGEKITLDTFSNLPSPIYSHFLSLCELAFNGVNKQEQVFHSSPDPLEHLGFMDADSELFVHQQSVSYSYNFLHLSVQEYLAAYHISLMSHHRQEQLLRAVDYYDHRSNMVRFLAGITKFKDLNKTVVRKATGIVSMLSTYTLELLYECQDVSILDSGNKPYTVYVSTDSLHTLHSLGYCIANSRSKWELKFKHKSNIGADIICHNLKKALLPNSYITSIDFESCSPEFTYQLLMLLPEYMLPHIESLIIMSADTQPLSPQVISRMERLETLILETISIDTSQPKLILDLSRFPTLRNLRIQSDLGNFEMLITTDSLSFTGTINASCTPKLVDMFLPQLPQQTIAHIGSLTVTYSYSQEGPQPLPPCLPELIPNMEKLNTLTLENVFDTSLTELIPILSRVPTLRSLTLHKLNLEGITLLCEWLPTRQLKTLTLHEQTEALATHKITINFCNSSIESIDCQYCTAEFIDQILTQLPQQSIIHVQAFMIWNEIHYNQPLPPCLPELILKIERLNTLTLMNVLDTSLTELLPALSRVHTLRNLRIQSDSGNFEMLFPTDSISSTGTINASCIPKLVDMILSQLPQQTIAHIELLTLKNVLDTSLTELIPVLSRVPTLRSLTLHKLNLEGITLLCEWLPTCQLETLPLHEQTRAKIVINFCNSSIESIDCQYCTAEFIDQILSQLPQQSIIHVKAFTICNDFDHYQQLPPCLPELIPRLEKLNTLTLKNALDTSLTELLPALSRVHALRNLRIQSDSGNFEMLFTTDSLSSTGTINASCIPKLVDMILSQLPQQTIALIGSLTITYSYSKEGHQPLPPCLPELIPNMEKLNTLTLKNVHVLDTSLTELLPALSRVHTLRSLTHKIVINFCNSSMESINCQYCTAELIDQILTQLPQQSIIHVQAFTIWNKIHHNPPLPSYLPGLIPKMERLNTLKLQNVLDTSLTELLPALSRVHTLRNLRIQSDSGNIEMLFPTDSLSSTGTINASCTPKLVDMILPQLPQLTIALIGSITITYSYSKEGPQPLPPCLPGLIPSMKRLNTLTLENVLDTSLTELIPVLSRVPTLRNLTLHKLNLEGITLLCEWLPTCQLETLTLHERIKDHKTTITFSNNSIEAIECQDCTKEFINQTLLLLSQQSVTRVIICNDFGHYQPLPPCLPELIPRMEKLNTLTLKNVLDTSLTELIPALSRLPNLRNLRMQSDSENLQMLFCKVSLLSTISGTRKLLGMFLPQLPQQILAHIGSLTVTCSYSQEDPQPLLSCLPELILKMERLNTLTLKSVLDTSLTKLIPVLSRVSTLRNLTLHKLNLEDSALLCQWLPTCQLETLTLHEQTVAQTNHILNFCNSSTESIDRQYCTAEFIDHILTVTPRIMITFYNTSIEAIKWQHCRTELIDQFLSQIPQQSAIIHSIKTLKICNNQPQRLPALIQGMEQLNTLHCLHKLNSEGIAHLCQWLPSCQLETLTLHSLSPDHSVMVCKALTSVSSLKTLDIRDSEFMTFLSMQALVAMLQQNQSLTELALTYCNIGSDGAHYLAEALHHNTTLKKLVMLGNPVGERGALAMAKMLKNNSTLEESSFIGANISSDSACCLVEALHHNTTLRKLDMRGNSVGDRGACAMAKMLKHNTTLKELCLSHTEISRDGAGAMAEALHHNTTLRKLDMRGNSVGEKGACAMAKMLKHNTTLKELCLSHTEISSDGAVTMAEALHYNTTLRKLDMGGNTVGERGACAMAEMLKHNTTLEELDLRDSLYFSDNRKIGNNGIKAAVESLVRNKNLKKLIVSSQYRDCVESLPVYQDVKGQVELC